MDAVALIVGGIALVAALAAIAGFVVARRRRTRARPIPERPHPRYPLALLHGAFGFDEVVVRQQRHAYFRGVSERLTGRGVVVYRPTVAPVAGTARRAAQLAEQVRALPAEKVNLIAHSQGGLDARYAITHLGLSDRVASLVTLGTPHLGTPLADLGHKLSAGLALERLLPLLGTAADLLSDLTTERMRAFNHDTPDHPDVFYGSVVGRIPPGARDVNPLLAPTHAWLRRFGESDGLVPVSSQEWGEVLLIVDADHWAQVGWSRTVPATDTPAIYEAIAEALRLRGL